MKLDHGWLDSYHRIREITPFRLRLERLEAASTINADIREYQEITDWMKTLDPEGLQWMLEKSKRQAKVVLKLRKRSRMRMLLSMISAECLATPTNHRHLEAMTRIVEDALRELIS